MEYDNHEFLNAIIHYGELEHNEIIDLNDGEPLVINGREVQSILDDDGLKYSYFGDNGVEYSTPFYIDDIPEEICDKIYEFLCDNWDDNYDFFNSLP